VTAAFYRTAAIASFASSVTTLSLIFLPDLFAPAEGFAGRMQRVTDPIYQLRAWIYLLHPFLVFTAALGIAAATRHVAPGRALAGVLAMGLWAVTEAGQQTLTLFAFDGWRRAWLAGDAAVRATMELRAAIYDGLWDASYGLLLIGFLIGNAFLAAILFSLRDGLTRIVGVFLLLAALLTLAILIVEVGGPDLLAPFGRWAYPAIQPLGRILIGVWLWRVALSGEPRLQAPA
jgi:hypothetical protein